MGNPAKSADASRCRETAKSKIKIIRINVYEKNNPKTIATFDTHQKFTSPATAGFLIPFVLVCFGLAPTAQAVGPDTDGSIPGSNNGEGIGVLVSRTVGIWNTGTGFEALNHLTGGNQNTATGLRALSSDTNGGFNTATGVLSLFSNTIGFFNSATGAYSLANNTDGNYNTANGYAALYYNTEGERNTATGFAALYRNTTGEGNTANGDNALSSNTTGVQNTATGGSALANSTTGHSNTATGTAALINNITGVQNTANGRAALFFNTTGDSNTANGVGALQGNSTGSDNTAIGRSAGFSITGSGNVCIGEGVLGDAGVDDTTWIRNINTTNFPFIAGTNNYVTVRMSDGALGYTAIVSSRRYKEDIKPMDKASEALLALKPATFRLRGELDPSHRPQWGLIAEDVEKVNPDLVDRNNKGEVESVRYEAINAMLLNEFLKDHRKVEEQDRNAKEQEATITQLKSDVAKQKQDFEVTVAKLTAHLEEQAAQIQKVSAELELNKAAAPRTVVENH